MDNCQWNSFTVWAKYVSLVPPFINRMVEIVLVAYLHDCDRFVCDVEKSLCVLWHEEVFCGKSNDVPECYTNEKVTEWTTTDNSEIVLYIN